MALTITTRDELIRALSALGYQVAAEQGAFDGLFSSGGAVAWADISDKPATFPPVVGTTVTTAKAGNYVPTTTEVANALKTKTQIAALAAITTPDGTDPTSTQTLANANKAAINLIIAALKA